MITELNKMTDAELLFVLRGSKMSLKFEMEKGAELHRLLGESNQRASMINDQLDAMKHELVTRTEDITK